MKIRNISNLFESYAKESFDKGQFRTTSDLTEDDAWLYERTLEEEVEISSINESKKSPKEIKPGDIILVNSCDLGKGQTIDSREHRIMVVNSVVKNNNDNFYMGFILSSQIKNSNKLNPNKKFASGNIYIDNYSSILKTPSSVTKPVIIEVADFVTFTTKDLINGNYYLGEAKDEFFNFVFNAYRDHLQGKDTSNTFWEGKK